ncbi:alcohol oxidase [Setomelanomma holmii]|uniref:Alcohol oxidase n=1 Tax=Setomelanomma holmii TaxID=210430 RepID=A0A9P4LTC2_9PLEO|nr:alcohol oxidase [Setomelanomma holmii]
MGSLIRAIFHFSSILPFVWSAALPQTNKGGQNQQDINGKTFDYIIVGGGLTGLVVANRLSEQSDKTVLVLENGYINDDISTQVPTFANTINSKLMYDITSAPDVNVGGKTYPVYVGNVVGGGSVVNGMAFDRASAADYDAWEQLGNLGWNWDSLLYYFKKSTTFTPPSVANVKEFGITYDASYYGSNGPVQASFPNFEYQDTKNIWAAFKAESVPLPNEHAAGTAVGAFWVPTSLQPKTQTRSSAKNAYYDAVKSRTNLILATGIKANEILFDQSILSLVSPKATGIQYISRSDNSVGRVYAQREVILAAGSVFTPQLLQLSGIGPRDILNAAGIKVKKDLSSVGANMQDHPNANVIFDIKNLAPVNIFSTQDPNFNASAWKEYETQRTGPLTQAHGSSLAFLSLTSITSKASQIVQTLKAQNILSFLPAIYNKDQNLLRGILRQRDIIANLHASLNAAVGEIPMTPFGMAISALQRPVSRGWVNIDPKNKYGNPVVQFNTFSNPVDRQILVEMVRWTRQHWAKKELAMYEPVEVSPGVQYQTDDEIINALIQQNGLAASFAHMSGTCSMMPELLGGCVGSDLTVYGTRQLSVVDASIIPLIPATHMQATMYAVAEKAADIIKARNAISSLIPFNFGR